MSPLPHHGGFLYEMGQFGGLQFFVFLLEKRYQVENAQRPTLPTPPPTQTFNVFDFIHNILTMVAVREPRQGLFCSWARELDWAWTPEETSSRRRRRRRHRRRHRHPGGLVTGDSLVTVGSLITVGSLVWAKAHPPRLKPIHLG